MSSFLISASLFPVADYAIAYLLRDPSGNLLASAPFIRTIPRILPPSHLSLSFPVALILIIGTFFFFRNTAAGYRFTIAGTDPEFARFGAIDPTRFWLPSLALSGAFHGLAGFFAVAGTYGRCHTGFSGGIGWSAVAVALIAGKYPLALIPAAFGYGALKSGSDSLLLSTGMSFESTAFIQAAVLFLATVQFKKVFRHVR
ncbi:hypothetical protein FACS1894172_16660 [Spirochaetia bacterium]|nr:hypothetical protein FACS1894172_16660 [Spirochaetia bacterium]